MGNGSQSLVEQAVFGFFLVLFFVAVALNVMGTRQHLRPAGAETVGQKRQQRMPPSGRSWAAIWARCVWEFDILKTYLAETTGNQVLPQGVAEPVRLAQPAESTEQTDRRRWTRHPSNLQAVCWLAGKKVEATWLAKVRDISGGGVGLLAPRKLPLGSVLNLQLVSPQFVDRTPLKAEVMFMSQHAGGAWILGCEFLSALTPEQQAIYL
jgi:hypothetical protein